MVLERKVDGEWYRWCRYDVTDVSDCNAMVQAAAGFGKYHIEVRVVEDENAETHD